MGLRNELEKITESGIEVEKHKGKIVCLAYVYPHTVEWIPSKWDLKSYNCFMYALGIHDNEKYRYIESRYFNIIANSEFVYFLLEFGFLSPVDSPVHGAVVLYSNNNGITHAARYISDSTVESKWGEGGLWCHQLLEVPENYGSTLNYYEPISEQDSIKAFLEYSESKGAYPIDL